jgi:hypothetical protein
MTATPSSSGTAIDARDFDRDTTSITRDRWDGGKLRAVLAARQPGTRFHVVTDNMTGHVSWNVELIDVLGPGWTGSWDRLLVRYHHADGTHHDTAYSSLNLGTIFTEDSSVKWDALKFWHDETGKALAAVRPVAEEHGQTYGRYHLRLTRLGVHVTYEPQRPEAGPKGYGEVIDGQVKSWATYGGYVGPHGSYRDLARS